MNRHIVLPLLTYLLLALSTPALSGVMPELLKEIEALQRRADMLAHGETGAGNYHLAKARTWLDLALSEYHEKEILGTVEAAIIEAAALVDALEQNRNDIPTETPKQITGSEMVRPDLWEKIAIMKGSVHFQCAPRALAEAEVHLVWAGHEKYESSWDYAHSYARSAEELVREAEEKIAACENEKNPPVTERLTLSSDALFAFGDATLLPSALWRLNRLADDIRQKNAILEEIELIGHTDRLRSDGKPERNQILSEQRAESVRQYLISRGISAEKVKASGAGSSRPLVECSTRQGKAEQIECLKPNRRVEIILHGAR